jgi:ArsR family transcriptional regulator, arsenate/arsenite/antimonite-responsive transcriptional repressor
VSDDESIACVARALAHPARVRIVRLLAGQTECRGTDVFSELPLAQSTISEHLRILKEAGVVSSRPVGTGMVYCVVRDTLGVLGSALAQLEADAPCCPDQERQSR